MDLRNIMLREKNQRLNSKNPVPVHLHEVQEQAKQIHVAEGENRGYLGVEDTTRQRV